MLAVYLPYSQYAPMRIFRHGVAHVPYRRSLLAAEPSARLYVAF